MQKPPSTFYAVCLVMAAQGLLLAALPKPTGHVNDFAAVLDAGSRAELDALLREIEAEPNAEIAVATVTSLDGLTVEEYANRLFQEWGIGRKAKDNGVLVLVAPAERQMRIEVGYGLEPILPDGLAGEIIRTDFLPRFRGGDYRDGIIQGVRRVAEIVRRNESVSADERRRLEESETDDTSPPWMLIPFLGLFVALGAFGVGVGLRTRTFFPLIWGWDVRWHPVGDFDRDVDVRGRDAGAARARNAGVGLCEREVAELGPQPPRGVRRERL